MKNILPLTALALSLTGGVALADRGHDNHRNVTVDHRGGSRNTTVVRGNNRGNTTVIRDGNRGRGNTVVIRDNHNRGWNGGSRVVVHGNRGYGNHGYYNRRPIYVQRPIIRERYYNYYRRPALIVENYGAQPGYYWVAGAWTWSGAEWIWQPGHYEPDQSYSEPGYDDGYYPSY